MTPYPFIIQGDNITVVIGNQPFTISKTHITYERVLAAIKAGDWELVKEVVDPVKVVLSFGQGNVSIEGETFHWKGREMHNSLSTRMIGMLKEGFDITPLANFMENLMSNPSKRAVNELYSFLEKNNLPITPEGNFLAYKRIRRNYTDCHTGTMDNSIGAVVEMERNEVDDNKDQTCSTGLHFCSHSYLNHFDGDRVVIVKINPRDVVSIPSDYNDAKGRACRYEVIGEVGNDPTDDVEFNRSVQTNANSCVTVDDDDFEEFNDFDDVDFEFDDWSEVDGSTKPALNGVAKTPTTGSGIFIRGYRDGYYGLKMSSESMTPTGDQFYHDGYSQGERDSDDGIEPRYEFVQAPSSAVTAKTTGPIIGSGMFVKGYHEGFTGQTFNPGRATQAGHRFYSDGYDKGETDRFNGTDQKYQYVSDSVDPLKAWPFPVGPKA